MGTTAATQEVAADRKESDTKHSAEPRPIREQAAPPGKPEEQPAARRPSKRRRKENGNGGAVRYFLTKAGSNGTPELAEEMPDEHQALIAALKQDRSYVTVKEWRAKVDIRKGEPVIGKDPVARQ
jgi:hypothetical protein